MPSDDRSEYAVGYKKPPQHTRFKKGRSGNPRGRLSGSKNLQTLLRDALNEPIMVTENGGRHKITKREAAFKQLVNEAVKGNWRALKLLVDILQDIERRTEPETAANAFGAADEKVLEQLRAWFSDGES